MSLDPNTPTKEDGAAVFLARESFAEATVRNSAKVELELLRARSGETEESEPSKSVIPYPARATAESEGNAKRGHAEMTVSLPVRATIRIASRDARKISKPVNFKMARI